MSLLSHNAELSDKYAKIIYRIAEKGTSETLKQLTELHLCVMCLAGMEGGGKLRFSEAVSALFSSPDHLSRRTLFWEDHELSVAYDWTKVIGEYVTGIYRPEAISD